MKSFLLFITLGFLWSGSSWAVVNPYNFTSSSGTYTEITGGTVLGTTANDDQVFNNNTAGQTAPQTNTGFSIGFNFTYNGIIYDKFAVNTNGWILLGSGSFTIGGGSLPISVAGPSGYVSAISGLGLDMSGQTGSELSYKTEGFSPNQVLTVQWKGYKYYGSGGTGDNFNFQIKLYETTNEVRFVYGPFTKNTTSRSPQVGIRGATNSDFHNRTTSVSSSWSATTKGTVNTASCTLSTTILPGNGLTFSFIPPALAPPGCASIVSPPDGTTNVCYTATLNWSPPGTGGTPTGYKLYFGTDNPPTNIVNGTNIGLVTTYDPTPDMLYSTPYFWKIVPTNGFGDAVGCPIWSFTTGSDPAIVTFPTCESFDGTTFAPCGWLNQKTAGTGTPGTWDRQTSGTNPTCLPHSGLGMARYNSYSFAAGTTGILVTPPVIFPSDNYRVDFWMYRDDGYSTKADLVNIYYNTLPTTSGAQLLGTINRFYTASPPELTANQWYEYYFDIPAGGGGGGACYFIFEAVSQYGNNMFIDDVCFMEKPLCYTPTGLYANSITSHSAMLGWASPPYPSWDVEYGAVPYTFTEIPSYSTGLNPHLLDYLSPNTTYTYKVRSDCGGGLYSTWAGPYTFTTLCDFTELPYSENFDGVVAPAVPTCITVTDDNGDNKKWKTYASNPLSSPNAMVIEYNTTMAMDDWFFTQGINLTELNTYVVKFWYRAQTATYPEKLEIRWGTGPSAAEMTGGVIWDNSSITNTTYMEAVTASFSPPISGVFYIGFHGYSDLNMFRLYVDDISIAAPVSIASGFDYYTVPDATILFGTGGDYPALPADFFGPGSDPFDGQVYLKGQASDGSQNPETDVTVYRPGGYTFPPAPSMGSFPVEMNQLHLVSVAPILVRRDNGGGGWVESFFDVYMSPKGEFPTSGMIMANLVNEEGGNFAMNLSFNPVFTFINIDDPSEVYYYDPESLGYPALEYSSALNCDWTLSPIPQEFDPIGETNFDLYSAAGSPLSLIPYLIRENNFFWVNVNEVGIPEAWEGNGYNFGEWFNYPNYNWWNVWFYDHPVSQSRTKYIKYPTMTLYPRDMGAPSSIEIVYNYSTTLWPTWTINPRPPLPADVPTPTLEDQLIARTPTLFQSNDPITIPTPIPLLNYHLPYYNPEWLSVDIRGYNFILAGYINHVCFRPTTKALDFGDAPEPYPTLLINDGARHTIVQGIFMGLLEDSEANGQPTAPADGDDINPASADDEDGVTFPVLLVPGQPAVVHVQCSKAGALLQGWIDFNADGDWADFGEKIATNQVTSIGLNVINFIVPPGAVPGQTCSRIRMSTMPNLTYTGVAPNGEVEDNMVHINAPIQLDFGDAADPAYPTLLANDGARHTIDGVTYLGLLVDAESDGFPTTNASGDDTNNLDDEDGVAFLWPLAAGNPCKVKVTASVGDALLSVWIDYNRNGSWGDPGEQVFADRNLVIGDNYLTFIAPVNVNPGTTTARFRFSHQQGLSYTGLASDGEVEDYTVDIIEHGDIKWLQSFDVNLPGLHSDQENFIADDWICNGGIVTDIHWWGNYETNYGIEERGLGINHFLINIYSDASCLPGTLLQTYTVPFSSITEVNTGFMNNEMGIIYYYEYVLPEPFDQVQGSVYWVSIWAISNDPEPPNNALWRWQEANRWFQPINCGAASSDPLSPWMTIFWPWPEPGKYSDMAFIITSQAQLLDYGDAPDPNYPTLLASNGARHTNTGLMMGVRIDVEPNGQPNIPATGDDINPPGLNDEDGVWWPCNFVLNQTSVFKITTNGPGFLNAWFDFNADGDWADVNEQIATNVPVIAGVNALPVTVPAGAIAGPTYIRFRFSTLQNLTYTGAAPDGEVEDYQVFIDAPDTMDYGDAPDPLYKTLAISNGARHAIGPPYNLFMGQKVDYEWDGQPNPFAAGDTPDEDGVKFLASLKPGVVDSVEITVSTLGPLLQGWIDFNVDGDWDDFGEQILTNVNPTALVANYKFLVPLGANIGKTYARFRFSTMPNLGNTGCVTNGEVEDYMVYIGEYDLGDAPDPNYPTLLASDGAIHAVTPLFLGVRIDDEPDGQQSAAATGDDVNPLGLDDEDGIWFPCHFVPGHTNTIKVLTTGPGFINAWFDFNADGDWADLGEQVFTNVLLLAGSTDLSVTVPLGAAYGTTFARFRYCSQPNLSYTGFAADGEVEDYAIEIRPAEDMDYGDAPDPLYPTLAVNNGARHFFDPLNPVMLGNAIDLEIDGQPGINADLDDLNPLGGIDDEDGIVFLTPLIPGMAAQVSVTVNIGGAALQGWIDFNADGDWMDANEQIFFNIVLPAGNTNLNFNVPPGATLGNTYARFRYSTMGNLMPYGCAPNGEVEDYLVLIGHPDEYDWGDLPDPTYPTLAVSNGPNHVIGALFLGSLIDSEADGIPHLSALGDDMANIDDEDGVVFTSNIIPGTNANVTVTASQGGGFLQGWMDMNADGDFDDGGEQIFINQSLVAGDNYLNFLVPAGAKTGATFARFRLSTLLFLGYNGPASDGEVEDYKVYIVNPQGGKMHWGQLPDLDPTGMDVDIAWVATADDFYCSETGPINKIRIWVSFADDILPNPLNKDTVRLQIFSDVPAGVNQTWSMPGDLLWSKTYLANQYNAQIVSCTSPEWWYDPSTQFWWPNNHQVVAIFDFDLSAEPFNQVMGNIYWLEVKYIHHPDYMDNTLGWKTTKYDLRFNDDAVWWNGGPLPDPNPNFPFGWVDHKYPGLPMPHPWAGQSFDMAFVLNPPEEPEHLDFGDAPDQPYQTLIASGGASHAFMQNLFMGNLIDLETEGQPDPGATGDNNNGLNDEDGIVFNTPLVIGQTATATVTVPTTGGLVQGWIDFNADGDWTDANEQIAYNYATITGPNVIPFVVPAGSVAGPTFARFRISTMPNLSFAGPAPDGEVEDYMVMIEPAPEFDFGDAPDPTYPTLLASDGARHQPDQITYLGMMLDSETDGIPSINADGDDLAFIDDEDGVSFLWPIIAGSPCKIKVRASVGDALLNLWIDYNGNGSWADPEDHVFNDMNLITGDNYLTFIVPNNAVPGQTYARFRFSHQPALSYTGYAFDGEVEDYRVSVAEYGEIKWQQLPEELCSGLHSDQTAIIADDWVCNGGVVTDIHWWGNYELSGGVEQRGMGINHFLIQIYSNAACLPGPVVQTYVIPFSSITEVNSGLHNSENGIIYYYEADLPEPFVQIQGTRYWVSIQAISNNPNPPLNAVWRWQEAGRWFYPIGCGAASSTPTSLWMTIFWSFPQPGQYSDMAFIITSNPNKILNLGSVFLEGLYNGMLTMRQAYDEFGPHWPDGSADHISVELHNAANYNMIEYYQTDVPLGTTGNVSLTIPVSYGGSYYVTIKHRNSIETTSASPVSFTGAVITYTFDTQAKAYGNNLGLMIDGTPAIYAGDVNQDRIVDGTDLNLIGNANDLFTVGYVVEDVNGDGLVDGTDMNMANNNNEAFVGAMLP